MGRWLVGGVTATLVGLAVVGPDSLEQQVVCRGRGWCVLWQLGTSSPVV